MRKGTGSDEVFYYCRAHYCPWIKNPCDYRKFIPASWDDSIGDDICHMLQDDKWLEAQLGEEKNRIQDKDKLIIRNIIFESLFVEDTVFYEFYQ
jgi:hypothetical protein